MKKARKRIVLIGAVLLLLIMVGSAIGYVAYGIRYPIPEGEFKVGCTKLFLTDKDRLEIFSDEPDDLRKIPVTVYYPAEPGDGDTHSKFASDAIKEAIVKQDVYPAIILDTIQPNSFVDAKPVAGQTFPVLLFTGGLYGQHPFHGSLLDAIAAEGYIVVAVEHPYSDIATENSKGDLIAYSPAGTAYFDTETDPDTLENNAVELCNIWTADMLYVFDSLKELNETNTILAGSMDHTRTGIFGFSFGGATSIQCLQERKELIVGVNMDGSLYGKQKTLPVKQPVVFMNNSQDAVLNTVCFQEKVAASQSSEACYHMIMYDSTHNTFATDSGLIYEKYPFMKIGEVADVNGNAALYSLTTYITAFFDQYLCGDPQAMLQIDNSSEYMVFLSEKYENDP